MTNYQIEALGWIAMVVTISSFAFTNMRSLRGINIFGCALWIFYGGLISSPQIIITNLAILSIHGIWFLRNRQKD
jgi:hypothetical protein